jgi:ribosomal protein L3
MRMPTQWRSQGFVDSTPDFRFEFFQINHRAPGSIGGRTDPGRVWKGKKMPGRLGGETKTFKNIWLYKVLVLPTLCCLVLPQAAHAHAAPTLCCAFDAPKILLQCSAFDVQCMHAVCAAQYEAVPRLYMQPLAAHMQSAAQCCVCIALYMCCCRAALCMWDAARHTYCACCTCFVLQVDPERNLLFVRGQVPGPQGSFVLVRDAFRWKWTQRQAAELPFPTHIGELPPVSVAKRDGGDPYRVSLLAELG